MFVGLESIERICGESFENVPVVGFALGLVPKQFNLEMREEMGDMMREMLNCSHFI